MARGAMIRSVQGVGLAVALAAFAVDQLVKLYLLEGLGMARFPEGTGFTITPFFNVIMVWNDGVSFGLFPAESAWWRLVLVLFSLTVVAVLAIWLWRSADRFTAFGIGLVIGGALGNVVDRLRFGAVADFFDFHAFGFHWYVFNVADAAIVCGVGLLMYESLFRSGQAGPETK